MAETVIQNLPPLEMGAKPHSGTPDHPGGQVAWILACLEYRLVCILCGRDVGKALDVTTPIPTIDGWKTMGDLKPGDTVFDETGAPCRVLFAHPVMEDRPCYRVTFSDGTSIVADEDHLWTVDTKKSRKSINRRTKAARRSTSHPETLRTKDMIPNLRASGGRESNYSIPVAGPVQYPYRMLPLHPYLLGVWLGDGSSNGGGLTSDDLSIVERLGSIGYEVRKHAAKFSYHVIGIIKTLRSIGVLNNKHIPDEFMVASVDQRLELLRGLMDTDGTVNKLGLCEFDQMSEALAIQVKRLVESLGMQTTMSTKMARVNGKDCGLCYRVRFTPNMPVFTLPRKLARLQTLAKHSRTRHRYITAIEPAPSVPVRCITVDSPSSLYLAGSACVPTHNTIFLWFLFWEEGRQVSGEYDFAYVAQGHPQAEKFFEWFLRQVTDSGLLVGSKNKGQDRWIRVRAFGNNRGATIHFWSGEEGALTNIRGVRLNRLAVDEAGFVSQEVEAACEGMLLSRNGRTVYTGTAKRGGKGFTFFKQAYDNGLNGVEGYKSFNAPSESSPFVNREAIAFARRKKRDPSEPDVPTPEEREEFDGAFISDHGQCFRNLDACLTLPYVHRNGVYLLSDGMGREVPVEQGRQYVIGADWGKKVDHSVFSVFDRETREQVALRIEPVGAPYEEQMKRLDALKRRYNNALVVADARDAGGYINERLRIQYGDRLRELAFTGQGPNSKGFHVSRVKHLFDDEGWHLLNVHEQRDQMQNYCQIPIGPNSDGVRYSAPAGQHDDVVTSCIFAATVLQITPAKRRPKVEGPPVLSPAWFDAEAEKRRRKIMYRNGL